MATKENPEEQALTETEDETIAAKKKRSRRVSFADVEITSVHIFKRDEDYYETTPPSDPNNNANPKDPPSSAEDSGEKLGLFADLGDLSNDRPVVSPGRYEDEDGDDDGEESRKAFFRPDDTPSPGSSNIGSATSNDEDNFFGPVSASFIRPGRLSDSATSDENHDVTMDSTAFSMHFRSLARSDSGGDFKTPIRMQITSEEKTPAKNVTPTDASGIMVLTEARLTTPYYSVPLDNDKSGGHDSNAMSLVGENSKSYDYGRLSPTLDALLAEGSKDLHPEFLPNLLNANSATTFEASALNSAHVTENLGNGEIGELGFADTVRSTFERMEVGKANFASVKKPLQQHMHHFADTTNYGTADVLVDPIIRTPEKLVKGVKQSGEGAEETSIPKAASSILNSTSTSKFKILQPNMPMHQGSANQLSTERYLKENLPHIRSPSLDRQQNVDRLHSPLAGSTSSLSSKRQQIFVDIGSSPANHSTVTPLANYPASLLSKESMDHLSSLSSLRKSISKLKVVEPSPRASSGNNGIEALRLKLANYLQPDLPYSKFYAGNNTNALIKHTNSPVSQLKLSHGDDQDDHNPKILSNFERSVVMTPNSTRKKSVLQSQDFTVVVGDRNLPDGIYGGAVHEHLANTIATAVASPSKFSWSADQAKVSHLIPRDSTVESVVTVGSSPFRDVLVDERKDKEEASMLNSNMAFSLTKLGQKMSPIKCNDDRRPDLKQQQHFFHPSSTIGKSLNFAVSDKSRSLHLKRTSLVDDSILSFQPQGPVRDPQDKAGLTGLREETFPGARNASSFTYLSRNTHRPSPKSPFKTVARSPVIESSKELSGANVFPSNNTQSGGDAILYSKLNASDIGSCQRESCRSKSSLVVHNDGEASGQKRKGEVFDGDRDHMGKVSRKEIISDVKMSKNCDSLSAVECYNQNFRGREKSEKVVALMHWKDVLSTLLSYTGEVLCPLADKLDLRWIDNLEGVLLYLLKARNYEILSCQIQSQRKSDQIGNDINGRLSEAVLLMYKIVYGKTIMQLKSLKRDKLEKAAQLLSSRIQECQNLRMTYGKLLSSSNEKNTQLDGFHSCSSSADANLKLEISDKKRTSVKQELEVLDKKLKDLTESLSLQCKIKGDPTGGNILEAVKSHLKKRMFCRLLHQDLQLWRFDAFNSQSDHQSISLNYVGLIFQRFTLTVKPIPNLTVSNKFEDRKVEKNFPNMDACVAFAFVFNSGSTKRYLASNHLAHETQTTHLLLQNLLDVVVEVQLARIKIQNLIWAKFYSPNDRQLDLLLCFADSNTCRKVEISLDMSCLNRGIYPVESIIRRVEATPTDGMSNSLPVSLHTEIRVAAEGLKDGQLRVMRLCQCISSVLNSNN